MNEERWAIERVLYAYGSTIDAKDYDGLRALLADDTVVTFGDREPLVGADAAVAFIRAVDDQVLAAHHHLTVFDVVVDGSAATATTSVIARQVWRGAPDHATTLAGRYHDRLARVGDRWLITDKRLDVVWRGQEPGDVRS